MTMRPETRQGTDRPSAESIRKWMQAGHDTVDIAKLAGCTEAVVWNELAAEDRRRPRFLLPLMVERRKRRP